MIVPGGMDRPNIDNIFSMGISESLISKRQPAQNNQQNPSQSNRFHVFMLSLLDDAPSALNQVDYEYSQSYQQKDVNESTKRVRRDHSEEPKNAQNHKNRPKHRCSNLTRDACLQYL